MTSLCALWRKLTCRSRVSDGLMWAVLAFTDILLLKKLLLGIGVFSIDCDGHLNLTIELSRLVTMQVGLVLRRRGEAPVLNRHALTLSPEEGPEISVTFPGTLRDRIGLLATNIVFVQFSALVLIAFLLRYHKISWSAAFGRINDRPRTLGLPILFGISFVVPALGLHLVSQQLIITLGGEPTSQEAVEMVARASAPPELALQALSVV